jgi:hypothetical protein
MWLPMYPGAARHQDRHVQTTLRVHARGSGKRFSFV